jgi:hypothetical protein
MVGAKKVGRTPAKLTLPPGRHQIRIQSGDNTQTFAITVDAKGANKWCYVFDDSSVRPGACPR